MLSASGPWIYLISVIPMDYQPHFTEDKLKAAGQSKAEHLVHAMHTADDTEPGLQSGLVSHQKPMPLITKLGGLPCMS